VTSADQKKVKRFVMGDPMVQLAVLGIIALFVILRLRSVLGTRTGFEPTQVVTPKAANKADKPVFDVIEGGIDRDIADHVEIDSPSGKALAHMKKAEPSFSVTEFIGGAGQAYEMILIAFEEGDRETLKPFLADDVYESFDAVISQREDAGQSVDATFIGLREIKLAEAEYDWRSKEGELTLSLVAELTAVVTDAEGKVIEGNKASVKRQKDTWTFAREMGSEDPNWTLIATGG
jgi:predicted lipid-binding transport protein (Tim44 family)